MAGGTERVVVIGGGPNGLVAALHLAKAGFAPLVLERRDIVGGVGVTEEIYPGFRCPSLMHAAGPLLPAVFKNIGESGLIGLSSSSYDTALQRDGRPLRIYDDAQRTAAELETDSTRDSKKYPEFHASLNRVGEALRLFVTTTPPDTGTLNFDDYLSLARFGLKFRSLSRKDAYRLLRWVSMPVADFAAEWFENELLRSVIAARGIFGTFAGPRSAGTTAGLLMQSALGGRPVVIRGGPGALTQALAKAAIAAGAQIRTQAAVAHIRVKNGAAHAVVLENGEEIAAKAVISNADPRKTFLQLLDATDLEPGFLTKIRAYRAIGTVAKVNLALSGEPQFSGVTSAEDASGRIHIGPDIDYLERAFDAAKYGDFSPQPYLDITIPSLTDPSLAPAGCHVMSIHVQYAPYRLIRGDWDARRDELGDAVLKTIAEYAPGVAGLIVHRQIITPLDMERTFGLTGGHMFHGEHALDQLFAFRPILGWARYRTPVKRLYLCGSGTHPGGGLTGAPGFNASREIVKDLKSRQ